MQCRPIAPFREIEGWLTDREALGLYRTAQSLPNPCKIVEIGSWKGKSTFCLAKGIRSGFVVAIDPFDAAGESGSRELYHAQQGSAPLVEQFKSNLAPYGLLDKIDIRAGYSSAFAGAIKEIDFLFIDGDHSKEGCEYDFRTFGPEVKRGGFLGFHDYDKRRLELGPGWVVETIVRPSAEWAFWKRHESLIIFKKV